MSRSFATALVVAGFVVAVTTSCERSNPPARAGRATPPGTVTPADTVLAAEEPVESAAAVLRAYYHAIDERRYDEAYRLWSSGGAASGKTLEEFLEGFTNTASVLIEVGVPGAIGAAAGSRYVEIPVRISAVTRDGVHQRFAGTYTLRRSVVDGATREQRTWRIASARIRQE